jgi:hypothetical protein
MTGRKRQSTATIQNAARGLEIPGYVRRGSALVLDGPNEKCRLELDFVLHRGFARRSGVTKTTCRGRARRLD